MIEPGRQSRASHDGVLLAFMLIALGVVLSFAVIPGIFTVDENNYLVTALGLRHGHLSVSNTAGLTPSRELLFFDPGPWARSVDHTPVVSTAPPLYAFMALPFSWGWRGLVALNTLCYLATTAMVFLYARRFAVDGSTGWLAAAAFGLGGFSIEYALGLWPHALSVALCTAAVLATGLSVETGNAVLSALAGFLVATASGVRYQNAIILAALGGATFLCASRRWRSTLCFALAAAFPLGVSSVVNHVRLQSWNPISKGARYFFVPAVDDTSFSWLEPARTFWSRVVDYSTLPNLTGFAYDGWLTHDATTGAHLIYGVAVKKALLQSAPWALLGLVMFFLAWFPGSRMPRERRRQLWVLSITTFAVLGVFSLSGLTRDDGLSFNQRYLLELVPLLAIGFAWAIEGCRLRPVLVGGMVAAVAVLTVLTLTPMSAPNASAVLWTVRLRILLWVPLLLAVALTLCWLAARRNMAMQRWVSTMVGVSIAWALFIHLGQDVLISQSVRKYHTARKEGLEALPDRSALIAYWSEADPAGGLLFNRDLVILSPVGDKGLDTPTLARELLQSGRRVFILDEGFPLNVRTKIVDGFRLVKTPNSQSNLFELQF